MEVASPELSAKAPRRVLADFSVQLNVRPDVKREWESEYYLAKAVSLCWQVTFFLDYMFLDASPYIQVSKKEAITG